MLTMRNFSLKNNEKHLIQKMNYCLIKQEQYIYGTNPFSNTRDHFKARIAERQSLDCKVEIVNYAHLLLFKLR